MKRTHGLLEALLPCYSQHYTSEEENMHPVAHHVLSPDCPLPRVPHRGRNGIATSHGQNEKKRRTDRDYRRRQKMKKEEREVKLQKLREQNMLLKMENGSCQKENELIKQELQSKLMETTKLRSEIDNSVKEIAKHERLLEIFTQQTALQPMVGPSRLEVALLENERSMFYQKVTWVNWILEREQLLDEIKKLRDRNVTLKMKNQVLADKILLSQGH